MWWMEFAAAFTIALIFIPILIGLLSWSWPGRSGGLGSLIVLFLLFFLIVWGLGTWIQPVGPQIWGTYLLPFVFVGFFLALLLAALAPPRNTPGPAPASSDAPHISDDAGKAAVGALVWVLLILMIGAIIVSYVTAGDEAAKEETLGPQREHVQDPAAAIEGGAGPDSPAVPGPSPDDDRSTEMAEDEYLPPQNDERPPDAPATP